MNSSIIAAVILFSRTAFPNRAWRSARCNATSTKNGRCDHSRAIDRLPAEFVAVRADQVESKDQQRKCHDRLFGKQSAREGKQRSEQPCVTILEAEPDEAQETALEKNNAAIESTRPLIQANGSA